MSREKPTAEELARIAKPVYGPRKQRRRPPVKNQGDLFADGSGNAKDLQKVPGEGLAAEAARSAAAEGEHRTAAAAGGDGPLFQYYGKSSDKAEADSRPFDPGRVHGAEEIGETIGSRYVVRSCTCRCWYCEDCGPRLGYGLRIKLSTRLQQFKSVFGVTLTVDGSLFDTPEQAWLYFSQGAIIGRFVRDLDRRGHLYSKAYFWVVEFQKDTEQPHWHVLLDAGRIPFGEIVEIYSRYRPSHAPALAERITAENHKGHAPGFGSVRFSPPAEPARAANYVTFYFTKFPQHGFPNWVLDRRGRVPRFNHSRGFFPRIAGHDPMCFCEVCRGEAEAQAARKEKAKTKSADGEAKVSRPPSSIRERTAKCRTTSNVVEVNQVRLPDGSVVDGRGQFVATLPIDYQAACEFVGQAPDESRQLVVDWKTADELVKFARGDDARGAAA